MRFSSKRSSRHGFSPCLPALCALLGGTVVLTTTGCGGSNNVNSPLNIPTTNPKVTISWPARSRDVGATTSALSAQLTLAQGDPSSGNPITFAAFNRDPTRPEAYTQTYTADTTYIAGTTNVIAASGRTGTMTVNVRFYANPDGVKNDTSTAVTSIVVGDATIPSVTIARDGTGIPNITAVPRISRVVVNADQTVMQGETKTLTFTTYDASNTVVAVSPGSAFFALTPGSSGATLAADGTVSDVAGAGTISVIATVDGIASTATSVSLITVTAN